MTTRADVAAPFWRASKRFVQKGAKWLRPLILGLKSAWTSCGNCGMRGCPSHRLARHWVFHAMQLRARRIAWSCQNDPLRSPRTKPRKKYLPRLQHQRETYPFGLNCVNSNGLATNAAGRQVTPNITVFPFVVPQSFQASPIVLHIVRKRIRLLAKTASLC